MTGEPAAALEVRSEVRRDVTLIAATGEIDLGTAPQLARHLDAAVARGAAIVLDLSQIRYMDSSGFRTLHGAVEACPVALVVPADGFINRAIRLAGLAELVPICEDVAAARRTLAVE